MAIPVEGIGDMIAAAGTIGTAAYGLVDATKVAGGGISAAGFGHIRRALLPLLPPNGAGLTIAEAFQTLYANWINGLPKAEQKAAAKSLIRLRLNEAAAPVLAERTGVDPTELIAVARKTATGEELTAQEMNALGRFDAVAAARIDAAYERADQLYRNTAKIAASLLSIVLALIAAPLAAAPGQLPNYGLALLVGVLAAPIAPVAKDASSAIVQAVGALRGIRR